MANTNVKELKYAGQPVKVEVAKRDDSGKVISSTYTTTSSFNDYKNTVTNALNGKANLSHKHSISEITNLQASLIQTATDINNAQKTADNAISSINSTDSEALACSSLEVTGSTYTLWSIDGSQALDLPFKTINDNNIVGTGNVTITASVPTADQNTAGIYKVMTYFPVSDTNWYDDDIVLTGKALKWVVESVSSFPLKTINGSKITGTGNITISASLPSDVALFNKTNGSFGVGSADWGRANIGTSSGKIGIFMRSMQLSKGESATTSCTFSSVNFTSTPLVVISETTSGNANSAAYRNNALVSSVTTSGCYIKSGKNNEAPYINVLAIGFTS